MSTNTVLDKGALASTVLEEGTSASHVTVLGEGTSASRATVLDGVVSNPSEHTKKDGTHDSTRYQKLQI